MTEPAHTQDSWLSREKQRDYRNAVLLQVLILVSVLVLEDMAALFAWPLPVGVLKFFFYLLFGTYLLVLWDMLRNFTLKRWLTRAVLATLMLSFSALFFFDVVKGGTEQQHSHLRFFCHTMFFGVQVLVIGFALRDLFLGARRDVDKLWGSACLFFMSGFAFASLYFCVWLKDPLAFGHLLPETHWALFESLYLSLTALIGLDNNAYPDCSRLFRNINLLEGAWSQLYMVLLIGRLLTSDSETGNRADK